MRLLIANQTVMDEEARRVLADGFGAEAIGDLTEFVASTNAAVTPMAPFVLLVPPAPRLLEDDARFVLGSSVVITSRTGETDSLYEPFFTAGVLDILLTPLPIHYLTAKMRVLIQRAKIREVREVLRYVNRHLPKPLTQTEVAFLRAILSRGSLGASRDQLQVAAWGESPSGISRSLDTHIFNLRRKLEDIRVDIHYRRADKRWTLTSANPKVRVPL